MIGEWDPSLHPRDRSGKFLDAGRKILALRDVVPDEMLTKHEAERWTLAQLKQGVPMREVKPLPNGMRSFADNAASAMRAATALDASGLDGREFADSLVRSNRDTARAALAGHIAETTGVKLDDQWSKRLEKVLDGAVSVREFVQDMMDARAAAQSARISGNALHERIQKGRMGGRAGRREGDRARSDLAKADAVHARMRAKYDRSA